MIEKTFVLEVGFEDLKSSHHFIESNIVVQAGASGFTMPSRVFTGDDEPSFWSP